MYRFKVGDRIQHQELPIQGVVVELMSFDEESGEPLHEVNVETPWYGLMWDDGSQGFEHDKSLVPETK